ncbi:MAG: STAS domain-containing protein [Spirochaetota bacterium]
MEAISVRNDGNGILLTITGEATIADAKRMREEFLSHLRVRHIALDLSGVTDADTTFLEIINAFRLSVTAAGGSLTITALSASVQELMRTCGYRLPSGRTTIAPAYRAA